MIERANSELLMLVETYENDRVSRGMWKHDDGLWSIGAVNRAVQRQFPDRPITPEISFDRAELEQMAILAMKGSPEVRFPKFLAALGGSVLILLRAVDAQGAEHDEPVAPTLST